MHTSIRRVVFCVSALSLASACGTSSSGSSSDVDANMDTTGTSSPDSGLSTDASSTGNVDGPPGTDGSTVLDGSLTDAGSADAAATPDGSSEAQSSASQDGASEASGLDATTLPIDAGLDATKAEAGMDATVPVDAAVGMDASTSVDAGSDAAKPEGGSGADASVASYYLGADVSFVQQEEDEGRKFYDTDGTQKDIFQILKNHGFNYVRLRTFVNPLASDGYDTGNGSTTAYCDAAHTVTMGARVKAAGMGLLLDFHYSDTWADPGHQVIPLAWQGDSISQLETQVQTYTNSVISQLVAGNARPDMVQIGNEITPGMLLPTGSNSSNFTNLGGLIKAGIAGVKAVDSSIKIMLHIDRGGDNATTKWWVNGVMSEGVTFDVLGESCYTNYQGDPSTWQTNFDDLVTTYPNLSFVIAEYDEDSADLAGNTECATEGTGPCNVWRRANDIAFGIPNKKGLGTFIWEPTEYEESLFDNQNQAKTNDPTGLPNPFGTGARIQLYDQMVTAYGL
jgi:arabinogalactan endo-1,4-beta-galactosidase